jgi:hypothetical protein
VYGRLDIDPLTYYLIIHDFFVDETRGDGNAGRVLQPAQRHHRVTPTRNAGRAGPRLFTSIGASAPQNWESRGWPRPPGLLGVRLTVRLLPPLLMIGTVKVMLFTPGAKPSVPEVVT